MKKSIKLPKGILCSIASFFVLAAHLVTASGSFVMFGESKCPKDLLK